MASPLGFMLSFFPSFALGRGSFIQVDLPLVDLCTITHRQTANGTHMDNSTDIFPDFCVFRDDVTLGF